MSVYCLTEGQWPLSSMKPEADVAYVLVQEVVGVVGGLRSSRSPLGCALEAPRTKRPERPHALGVGLHQCVPRRLGHFWMVRLSSRPQTISHLMAGFSGQLTRVPTQGPVRAGLGQGCLWALCSRIQGPGTRGHCGAQLRHIHVCPHPPPGAQASARPFWNAGVVAVGGSLAPGILL